MTELDLSDDLLKSLISARKDPGQKDHQPVGKSQPVGPVRDTKSLFWYRLIALPPLAILVGLRQKHSAESASEPVDKWSLFCRAFVAFGSAALFSLASLWFFYRIYRIEDPLTGAELVPESLLALCTLVVIVANLVVSVLFQQISGDTQTAEVEKPQKEIRCARVSGATILSRLGSEYLLRFETEQKNITMPKAEVVSWAVRRED